MVLATGTVVFVFLFVYPKVLFLPSIALNLVKGYKESVNYLLHVWETHCIHGIRKNLWERRYSVDQSRGPPYIVVGISIVSLNKQFVVFGEVDRIHLFRK